MATPVEYPQSIGVVLSSYPVARTILVVIFCRINWEHIRTKCHWRVTGTASSLTWSIGRDRPIGPQSVEIGWRCLLLKCHALDYRTNALCFHRSKWPYCLNPSLGQHLTGSDDQFSLSFVVEYFCWWDELPSWRLAKEVFLMQVVSAISRIRTCYRNLSITLCRQDWFWQFGLGFATSAALPSVLNW